MTIDTIDWGRLSSHGNPTQMIFEMLIPDKLDTLKRVHAAICKWHEVADQELEQFRSNTNHNWKDAWDEYGYDPVDDESFVLAKCEQALWGGFAVAIFATIENALVEICTAKGIALTDRANWGEKKNKVEQTLGIQLSSLAGFAELDRVRVLGNCFKHNGGNANDEYTNKYHVAEGSELEFNNEDWHRLLENTRDFLTELAKQL